MQGIYDAAELYHYGFNFRDTARDANILINASDRFGNGGRRFLEIACGNCPYALDLIQAGVDYHGLDLSDSMMTFAQERLAGEGVSLKDRLHQADMRNFSLPITVDLAFVLMGSLHYLNNNDFLRHLDCVHQHMSPGGLYVLEWCIDYVPSSEQYTSWTEDSPHGEVRVHYHRVQTSALDQRFAEAISLYLNGKLMASTTDNIYLRYPHEFRYMLVSRSFQWEIVNHFDEWDLDTPMNASSEVNRPLCILRKK